MPLKESKKTGTPLSRSRLRDLASQIWRWLWTERSKSLKESPHDKPTPHPDSTRSSTTEISRDFTVLGPLKFIAWLGASAGGLTLLLVVIGFLALSAHDAMLGIPRSIQNNPEYVAVGGLFFGRSIIFTVVAFISLKSWIVVAVFLSGAVLLLNIPRRPSHGRSLVIGLFGVLLLGAEVFGLERLIRPLQISNLLLDFSVDANAPGKQVVDAILVKDTSWLGVEYGFLVLLVLILSLAFLLLEQQSREDVALNTSGGSRNLLWRLIRVPALILLIICIFLLPRAYGVLTIANNYPAVNLEGSSPSVIKAQSEVRFLLREDDRVFILYDPTSQSIVSIKRELIEHYRIYAPQHIFTASLGKK